MIAEGDLLAVAFFSTGSLSRRFFARCRGSRGIGTIGPGARGISLYSESAAEAMDQLAKEWTPKLFYWAILLLVAALIIRAAMAYKGLIENLLNVGG